MVCILINSAFLSFISKVIERVVPLRILDYNILDHIKQNNLLDPMQSAYRAGHSTETALLRVHSDIVNAISDIAMILTT